MTLISAGTPALGFYSNGTNERNTMTTAIDTFVKNTFVNSYANDARNVTYNELNNVDSSLRNINCWYWYPPATANGSLYLVRINGTSVNVAGNHSNLAAGVRPVVTLKPGVMTNSNEKINFLNQTCWNIYPKR